MTVLQWKHHAHLAQLAEQLPCKEKVAGSTPVVSIEIKVK